MLSNLEKELKIQYPKPYKELEVKDMLQVSPTGNKVVPSLLYPDDEFWLMTKGEILEDVEAFYDEEHYLQVDKKHKFIPFARSGAGDLYCFLFSEIDKDGDIPIVYFWHDDIKADYLAKNLEDFIFMSLLRYITEDGCINVLESDTLDMNTLLESHKEFINLTYYEILKEKYELYNCHQPMPLDEYEETVQTNIMFEKYESSFDYTIDACS